MAIARIRKFASEKNIHITLIIHPRKEDESAQLSISSIFGTAKATQEADNVIILQKGKAYRYIEVTKNRFCGDLGKVPFRFDPETLKFHELTPEEIQAAEVKAASAVGRGRGRKMFDSREAEEPIVSPSSADSTTSSAAAASM
jgi:twinkle protein